MTGPERDSDVDAWLQTRRSLLRNADEALTLEPPPELDQRVIDRARRELVRERGEKPGFFRGSRFTMPFAIAATVVLSFSLVLEINRYEGGRDALRERAENSAAAPITLTAAPAPMASATATITDNAAADAASARRTRDKADQRAAAPAMQADTMAAAPPAPAAPPPMIAMEQAAPASIASGAIESASMSAAARNAAPSASPGMSPSAASGAALEARRAEPAESGREASAAKSSAADAVAAGAPARPRSAAQWWKLVQQLRDSGRNNEAEAELKALRQAHPDFVVPAAQAQPQQ